MEQEPNYGRSREPGDEVYGESGQWRSQEETSFNETYSQQGVRDAVTTMSPQDEKTWSVLSHVSVLLMMVFLPVGALVSWLLYKDRSPKVRFHALQALWYQLAWYGIWIVGGAIGGIFTFVTFGFGALLVIPIGFVAWLFPLAHGCYAAYKVSQGVDYRYPFIADKIDGGRRDI